MNMELDDVQRMIQESVRKALKRELSINMVRELQGSDSTGHSPSLWRQLAEDGWIGLAFPEEYGGNGLSVVELGILFEEAGRALAPTTLNSTLNAALVIEALGTEEQKENYLGGIARGEIISTVAFAEPTALNNPAYFNTYAHQRAGGWVISGIKSFVQNAHLSDPMVVLACTEREGGKALTAFVVSPNTSGVEIKPQLTFGRDRQSKVSFNEVFVSDDAILGGPAAGGSAWPGVESAFKKATALQCCEMLGGMQQVLAMTVQYTTERTQFGKPIGAFQAVQHHVANMSMKVDGARLVCYQALWLIANNESADKELAIAKAWISEAYRENSLIAHQVWGGMGYAEETDLFLWSNRAIATSLSFGTEDDHLDKLADLILGEVS